jgi:hypothetical protein
MITADSWTLQIDAINNYNSIPGDWITMGVCDGCNDEFQYNEDEYDTPDGPIDYTDIQFYHLNWYGTLDSNGVECTAIDFASDYRSFHDPSNLLIWDIYGSCADEIQNTTNTTELSWLIDNLDEDYEVYMYVGDNGTNMRFTTSVSVSCDDLGVTADFIDGEWVYSTNVKVLMGGCASSGLTTFYWDEDGDGWGSDLYSQYCSGFEPEGWVADNSDLDDTAYCESNDFDSCWICDGGNVLMDCNGVCSPDTSVGEEQENEGLVYGAFPDECGICSGGSTGHEPNSDQDCNQDCFGSAYLDDCDICSGGNTGNQGNSDQDCAGVCFGNGFYDYCDECNGYNQSCLDLIFGDGPTDLYAQVNLDLGEINLTWIYNDINVTSDQIVGYKVYEQVDDVALNLISTIESTEILDYTISGYTSGIFCLSVFDLHENETTPICAEASEFYNFAFELAPDANLISFPYLSNADMTVETIFSPIASYVDGIITEGDATYNLSGVGWVGSLTEIDRKRGYWVKMDIDGDFLNFSVPGISTDPNTVYNLHDGANLISYAGPDSVLIGDALPDNMEYLVEGIITAGSAASPNPALGWVGSLQCLQLGKGYWLKIDPAVTSVDLVWNLDNIQSSNDGSFDYKNDLLNKETTPFEFTQSTLQSFYFIKKITANLFNLDDNDVIISYCNDILVGSRYYNGEYTDVPAMGADGENTIGYCSDLDIPNFKIYDAETNRTIDLFSQDIPHWENLGISEIVLSDLSSDVTPNEIEIILAYPNPFNPSTKIDFNINKNQYVELFIYDIHGKIIERLINQEIAAGVHSIKWTPNNISSGVYILSLNTASTKISSKLLYIK